MRKAGGVAGGTDSGALNRVTGGDRKVLKRMSLGAELRRDPRGGWRVGGRTCGVDVLDRLRRHDLVEPVDADEARFRISGPGMAHLMRREDADMPNRLMANAADDPRHRDAAVSGARRLNRAEEPLAWLYARGLIGDRQFEAGERLRSDFMAAGRMPRTTMAWDAAPVAKGRRAAGGWADSGLTPSERQVAAKRRLDGALEAVGPGMADVLLRVACAGEGLFAVEGALGWPARSGKVVLGLAPDRVAAFYRGG